MTEANVRASGVGIWPIKLADLELPDFHPAAPGSDTVYGFLVRDGEACVLVDTGVGEGSDLIDRLYAPKRVAIPDALARVGASVEDLTAVVNSHLHFDHCGGNALFRDVPIFVQQAELEAAEAPRYTVRDWIDFERASYVALNGDHAISEHLKLVHTPGHTPGHQSLVVDRGGRIEIVVAQAAYRAEEFGRFGEQVGRAPAEDPDATLRGFVDSNATSSSATYLASLHALWQHSPTRAYFSHDATVWARPGVDERREPGR